MHDNLHSLGVERLGLVNFRLGGEGKGMPSSGVPLAESLGALIELRDQGLIEATAEEIVALPE